MKKLLGLLIVIAFIAIPFSHADARHRLRPRVRIKLCHILRETLTRTDIPCQIGRRLGVLWEVTAVGRVIAVTPSAVVGHILHGDFPVSGDPPVRSRCGQIIGFKCFPIRR